MGTRLASLVLRPTPEDKQLLDQAAALDRKTLTSFALSTLLERARVLMAKSATITLSRHDMKRFFEILEADEEPAPTLKSAVRRYRAGRG